jgi:hypothetical protein
MKVMTHYRLIMTKDCQKTDLTSRQVTALARTSSYSKLEDPSSRQRGRYNIKNSNCLKENLKENENWSWVPDGRLTPSRTGRLIVGRNVTLTFFLLRKFWLRTSNVRDEFPSSETSLCRSNTTYKSQHMPHSFRTGPKYRAFGTYRVKARRQLNSGVCRLPIWQQTSLIVVPYSARVCAN